MWINFFTSAKFLFYFLMTFTVVFEVIGDYYLEKWGLVQNKNQYLLIGLIVYMIGTVFFAFTLRYEFLSKGISIFSILNLIAAVLVGVIAFHEKLSAINIFGILIGIVSIVLVSL